MRHTWPDILQITLYNCPKAKLLIRDMLDELFLPWPHLIAGMAIIVCAVYSVWLGGDRFATEAEAEAVAVAIMIVHIAFRIAIHRHYLNSSYTDREHYWTRLFFVSALVSGLAWGTSLSLLIVSAPDQVKYLTLTIACVIIQSATARAFMAPLPLILQTLVLVIMVVSTSAWNGDWVVAPAAVLFIAFQAGHMRNLIAMRFREWQAQKDKDHLLAQLAKANDDLSEANEALRKAALTDGLTGLANRRAFDLHLELYCSPDAGTLEPVSLIFFDVDRFKSFNDTHGHQAGDQCLEIISRCARAMLTDTRQLAARYGGEEFALILPGTKASEARNIAEALRELVCRMPIPVHGEEVHITISLGIATTEVQNRVAPRTLLARADLALYRAKQRGRNRVEVIEAASDAETNDA
ncbi:GGDEF domain-containing protein [Rhizobium lemnae]|uniref:diguanylate cyclase n=1 Tax=Rhizobium lemnae TaxID=1214924 RepID=A0ABV8E7I7_9HYPH|nr:GGDEF domain-containing protein [Rhizobium lemnae]MCJ8509355.1 GGDEF domain-containing protein [Rhizobium lemnae]